MSEYVALLLLYNVQDFKQSHPSPISPHPPHLGVMTITLAVSGSILQAACMLWMVPGVKKSQFGSPTSTP